LLLLHGGAAARASAAVLAAAVFSLCYVYFDAVASAVYTAVFANELRMFLFCSLSKTLFYLLPFPCHSGIRAIYAVFQVCKAQKTQF
jgi:hypothetical protein